MTQRYVRIHERDNVLVALQDIYAGERIEMDGIQVLTLETIPAKHKVAMQAFQPGDDIIMYGQLVGRASRAIAPGQRIRTENVSHAAKGYTLGRRETSWTPPDVSAFQERTFEGYHRADGSVGTANYWIVIPMVFCETHNLQVLQEALVEPLGYGSPKIYQAFARRILELMQSGADAEQIRQQSVQVGQLSEPPRRLFAHVDGVKFLNHTGGCGGTRADAEALCGLLAGYITHPNVAGATVLSLGCQNAQVNILKEQVLRRDPKFSKPLLIYEQQKIGTESELLQEAIRGTLQGLHEANTCVRKPAPLSKLTVGLECGGSDGFSGISANPTVGYVSDMLVALGATVILSEFPELCGVEQELGDRCVRESDAERFYSLMKTYAERASDAGSGFDMNPSPGNIRDGLITDAMKSAGAAKKGGNSPVTAVLDYPEKATTPGLNLLCTPGNDVESTTAEVAAGANVVLFTTGLGTPTGNPIAPVIKMSSNTPLAQKMPDIIDINTGTLIDGTESLVQLAHRTLEFIIHAASGNQEVAAVRNRQEDFIPWKRGISL